MARVKITRSGKRRRGELENMSSGPPKKGVLQNFTVDLPTSPQDTDSSSEHCDSSDVKTHKGFSVGTEGNIVFDVKIISTDEELSVELIRVSQNYDTVHLINCTATAYLYIVDVDDLSYDMELYFTPMTFTTHGKSSARANEVWPPCDGEKIIQYISISGSIMYEEPPLKMQKEISTLLNNKENSDVEICVGEEKKKFVAHKCILSARSSFFQAMFSSNMRETIENVVNLPDESPEVFEQLLKYIYTDSCPKMSEMPLDLLVLADKYDVKGLLEICEEVIEKTMNTENVCDYLVKSEMINANKIYDKCYEFILINRKVIMKTAGWEKLKEMAHSHKLLSDVIKKIEKQ